MRTTRQNLPLERDFGVNRTYIITATIFVALLLGALAVMVIRGPMRESFASCEGTSVAGADIGGPFTLVDETGQTVTDRDVITGPTLVYFGFTNCPDVCPIDSARNAVATTLLEERGIDVRPVLITVDPQRDTPEEMAEYTDNFHPRMLGLTGSKEQIATATTVYRVYSSVSVVGGDEARADSSDSPDAPSEGEAMAMDSSGDTMADDTMAGDTMTGDTMTGDMAPEAMESADMADASQQMDMDMSDGSDAHGGHKAEIRVDHSAYTYLMMPERGMVDFFDRDISAEDMADRVSCAVRAR